jgi:hypothetical protein
VTVFIKTELFISESSSLIVGLETAKKLLNLLFTKLLVFVLFTGFALERPGLEEHADKVASLTNEFLGLELLKL